LLLFAVLPVAGAAESACGQDFAALRTDQLGRLQNYVLDAIQPSGLVRDSLVLSPNGSHFHPATPDAAGFALLSLSAFDQLGTLPDAELRVEEILRAHAGQASGVTPDRSADGHFVHFMNVETGVKQGGGWDESYSPISSALLVSGAQFASKHFSDNVTIAALADELTQSVDFNAAIHPSLDGRIYLDMTKQGGGAGGAVASWNEYMLAESLALRQDNNDRAVAVKHLWLNADNLLTRTFRGHTTLTDNPGAFAPAFWVQQSQFFNGDFRQDDAFQEFLLNQQLADKEYSELFLSEEVRYGLTAGVSPDGYQADRIMNHPGTVFSPEAVAAWGDEETLLAFYADQPPASDPRYRYGMVRVSQEEPNWVPFDAGLVDHLFLLYGLVETIDADFFADRLFTSLLDGDYNFDGVVDASDYSVWRESLGSTSNLAADGDLNGVVDESDFELWRANFGSGQSDLAQSSAFERTAVPEPSAAVMLSLVIAAAWCRRVKSKRAA